MRTPHGFYKLTPGYKKIPVDKAIRRGHLLVNYPAIAIWAGIMIICFYLLDKGSVSFWILPVGFVVAMVAAWIYWRLMFPRWYRWSLPRVDDIFELEKRAKQEKLAGVSYAIKKNEDRPDKRLENEKNKLIEDLRKGDINFLLRQMNNDELYSPKLIKKQKERLYSGDHISWYAYRRAEELDSATDREILKEKLNAENDPMLRKHIYFCLAHLCKNTEDKDIFNFLTDHLAHERDHECKSMILIGISKMEKDASFNIEPIKNLVRSRSRELRWHSIIALKKTHDSSVEDLLLSQFIVTKDSHIKGGICHTLETTGTAKSIPVLTSAMKKTRSHELKYKIENAIEMINKRMNL